MGLLDRFRRSSRTEPERSSSQPSRSSSSADKKKGGDQGSSLASDQELLDSIAALMGGEPPASSSTPVSSPSAKPSVDSSSGADDDLLSAMAALMGQSEPDDKKPEPEPEPEPKPEPNPESEGGRYVFDAIVDLMHEQDPGLRDRVRESFGGYAEPKPEPEPEPEPEPKPEPKPADEPEQDLLSALAALMGQDPSDEEPIETEPIIDVVPIEEPASAPADKDESEENPFSAIAALMGQGPSDDEEPPADEPEPKDDSRSGDDLLASLAALMGQSMYGDDQADTPAQGDAPPAIDPALEERLRSLAADCDRFTDQGDLASAKAACEEAYAACKDDDRLRGAACRNYAALSLRQLGEGLEAARLAREALECGDAFEQYAESLGAGGGENPHEDCLRMAVMTAASYDEAIDLAEQGAVLYPSFEEVLDKIRHFREFHPRWADYQRDASLSYYSRVSAEQDKGDYAPAMSLLQVMLDRADDENYQLSSEERAGILDDYGTIAIMHLLGKARSSGLSQEDFSKALSFIADGPLKAIGAFLPECRFADKQKIDRIIQGMKMLPGVANRDAFAPFR